MLEHGLSCMFKYICEVYEDMFKSKTGAKTHVSKLIPVAQTSRHPDILTDGLGESMTESAQWGRFSENKLSNHEYIFKYD